MAQTNGNSEPQAPSPQGPLPPFDGPTCTLALLVLIGTAGGAIGGDIVLLQFGVGGLIGDLLFSGIVGGCGGAILGMPSGIITGQVARIAFEIKDRRPYQVLGALIGGVLFGALACSSFVMMFSGLGD